MTEFSPATLAELKRIKEAMGRPDMTDLEAYALMQRGYSVSESQNPPEEPKKKPHESP